MIFRICENPIWLTPMVDYISSTRHYKTLNVFQYAYSCIYFKIFQFIRKQQANLKPILTIHFKCNSKLYWTTYIIETSSYDTKSGSEMRYYISKLNKIVKNHLINMSRFNYPQHYRIELLKQVLTIIHITSYQHG